ncbi:diguanylate cyclase [Alteromonas pelagimontana]|uniref:diguanylate cyclase n=1 Tax=Alteromonas pelagimontana TaxID=1858656 RepID=A0A6M4M9E4_9ALTE|nr:diguanylate cyclase [Alteromonas pelagimontana]QJR79774.1 diguanylate cyclase [Alteromonas pelagimontana]
MRLDEAEQGEVLTPKREKPRLLVVDDQAVNVRLIYDLFQSEFSVFMATNGEMGLAKSREIMPDIILLDVVMDGLNGYDLCRQLKADETLKHIPVIFITGQFNEEDEVYGFKMGAVDFIHKPINPVITRARVMTHMQHKLQADILRNISMLDGLTNIANRRHFNAEIERMWRNCAREQQTLSLIIIDIDYFKQYNDHYGHLAGDSVLRKVAESVTAAIKRPQDLAARVGGEEFALLLPNTPEENLCAVLERLFTNIRVCDIAHDKSPLGKLSVSAGCSSVIPKNTEDTSTLYKRADTALYRAKQQGKNQYVF